MRRPRTGALLRLRLARVTRISIHLLRHPKLFELCHDIPAVSARFHCLVDEENVSVFADVKRPAGRELAFSGHDAEGFGDFAVRIAKDGIIQFQRFSELLVRVGGVATGGEIGDIKFPNLLAARTERLALSRSATCKRFGEPCYDDSLLAFEI